MNHRQSGRVFEIFEILLSLAVIVSAVILVPDWEANEVFFVVAFAAAALLFITRGIRTIHFERGHIIGGLLYLLGALFMFAFLTGSALTIWGGGL